MKYKKLYIPQGIIRISRTRPLGDDYNGRTDVEAVTMASHPSPIHLMGKSNTRGAVTEGGLTTARYPDHISFYLMAGPRRFELVSMEDLPEWGKHLGGDEDHVAVLLKDLVKDTYVEGHAVVDAETKKAALDSLNDGDENLTVLMTPREWSTTRGNRIAIMTVAEAAPEGELTASAKARRDARKAKRAA